MASMTRREFIQTGAAGAALLVLVRCTRSHAPGRPPFDDVRYAYRSLTGADRELVAAVAGAMLAGALPAAAEAYETALVEAVRGVDVAIAGLAPGVQAEVHQLFGLLEFPITRGLAAGIWSSWNDASPSDVAKFLTRWRFGGATLYRSGYQALHQLVMGAWYGNANSWARIGYPGPPVLSA